MSNDYVKKIKIVAISDTHGNLTELQKAVDSGMEGDIFIHGGDFTNYNKRDHFSEFIKILGQLKFTNKIVIPGNHEIILDSSIPL